MVLCLFSLHFIYAMNNSDLDQKKICLKSRDNLRFRQLVCMVSDPSYRTVEIKVLYKEATKVLKLAIEEERVNDQISLPKGISCNIPHLGKTMLHFFLELHVKNICDVSKEIEILYKNKADFKIKDQDQISPRDLIYKNHSLHIFKKYCSERENISPLLAARKDVNHFLFRYPLDCIKEIYNKMN